MRVKSIFFIEEDSMFKRFIFFLFLGLVFAPMAPVQAAVATFDDLTPTVSYTGGGNYENGLNLVPVSTSTGFYGETINHNAFRSAGASFRNNYIPDWFSWDGWSYSNTTDLMTAGIGNQYTAYNTPSGGGHNSNNYGVFFEPFGALAPTIDFGGPVTLSNAWITNTTYDYLAVVNGDDGGAGYVTQFGAGDWFKVTVWGFDAAGRQTHSLDIYLADYTDPDSSNWYALDAWTSFDLSALGTVYGLGFDLNSTDTGAYGMNTPAYFAMDNLEYNAVPVPGAVWLLGSGLVGLLGLKRRKEIWFSPGNERIKQMKRLGILLSLLLAVTCIHHPALAGPYAPAAGQAGSTAIHMDDSAFIGWATGWKNYIVGTYVDSQWQDPNMALGKAVGTSVDIACLGRGGQITMVFDTPISDGEGWDFAVFENSFSDTFLELAYIEVSSDGENYYRFDNISLTSSVVGGFGSVDPSNVTGFAGKYRQGYGTPFDLDYLHYLYDPDNPNGYLDVSGLDFNNVRYARLLDILGDGTCLDTFGNVIYDPYPTTGSAGFDLDAVGVINQGQPVPLPGALCLLGSGLLTLVGFRRKQKQ